MIYWTESAGLNLATMKVAVVLFTCRCPFSPPSFHLKGEEMKLCTVLKFLGVWFDGKLTFKEHAKQTAAAAERIVMNTSRLMLNLGY